MNKFIKLLSLTFLNAVIILFLLVCCDFIVFKITSLNTKNETNNSTKFSYLIKKFRVFGAEAKSIGFFTGEDESNRCGKGRLPDGLLYAPPL